MFAYCNNNPIIHHDKTGDFPWLIFGIILGGGVLGAILGYSSEEKLGAKSSNEMPMSRNELKYPTEITEDDLKQPVPAPEEPLTTGDRVNNAFLGGLMGIAGGGLIVFGTGAAATVTVGASTFIPALGATAGQTWAIGAVVYDLVGMIFAPLLGVEMEPIEIEEIEIKPR